MKLLAVGFPVEKIDGVVWKENICAVDDIADDIGWVAICVTLDLFIRYKIRKVVEEANRRRLKSDQPIIQMSIEADTLDFASRLQLINLIKPSSTERLPGNGIKGRKNIRQFVSQNCSPDELENGDADEHAERMLNIAQASGRDDLDAKHLRATFSFLRARARGKDKREHKMKVVTSSAI